MRRLLALAVLVAGLTGCSRGLEDVPLPSLVDGPTHEVEAVFASALNLPEQAPVKVDGATVGQVSEIVVRDYQARVRMDVLDTTRLHEGVRAEVRLTSPMGTAFVELTDGPGAPLGEDVVIPAARTDQAPDVSDLLSALSVVVTGGSFGDIATIVDELNVALDGGGGDVRRLLARLSTSMGSLQDHTAEIDATLTGLDRLTAQLAGDRAFLARAVTDLGPAVRALARQRGTLMDLLGEVRAFGTTSARTLRATRADLVAALASVGPVLESVHRSRHQLVPIMEGILRFGERTDAASPGDYSNFDLTFELDPSQLPPQDGDPPPLDDLGEVLGDLLGNLGGLLGGQP